MTRSRRISPQEWVQDYYSPLMSVLTCPDVDRVCAKNNLTLTEMLQPFSRLLIDITVKDPEGINHSVSNLCVTFQDFKKDPSRLVNPKLLSDLVSETCDEPMISRSFGQDMVLEAPGFTPWYDTWMRLYLHSIPSAEHEFLRNHIGCVLAVSSNSVNPLDQFRALSDKCHKHHHEKPTAYPQFIASPLMKNYVLVHDVYECKEVQAQEIFTQMQNSFGSANCHFLQINSRTFQKEDEEDKSNPAMMDYWFGRNQRFTNAEARKEGMGATVITTASSASANVKVNNVASNLGGDENSNAKPVVDSVDHPLAVTEKPDSPPPPSMLIPNVKLLPLNKSNVAAHLTSNDVDRIRIFIRELCIKGIIPFMEKQMKMLNEILTNRKSRSFLSGAKRWFGQNKSGSAPGTSVVYSREAPELQTRKLADLFFMIGLYKLAYNCYHTCKKDFLNDEAWNYYAGASELAALSIFMMNDSSKKYASSTYMDDAVVKYLQVCQMPEFAIRATMFDGICLKYLGMFHEAAVKYIKMTNEAKDLRSSLFFEQASYCFLLSSPPSIRKYGFHIILSGYRYSKAGQKKHSARAYQQGFQVYKKQGWALAEDHILYNMGHQSLLLKDHSVATQLFNDLLSIRDPNPNPLQQMCHLREFFIVHHLREKENKEVPLVTIPSFLAQNCILDLSDGKTPYETLREEHPARGGMSWQNLEKVVVERIQQQEVMILSKTCQTIFTPVSCNNLRPQGVIGEHIRWFIPVQNKFLTTLLLKNVMLLWKFFSNDQSEPIYNNKGNASSLETFVKTDLIESVSLEKSSTIILEIGLTVMQPGELFILGIEYGMKAQFPQSETTDYTIGGKQMFDIRGPRLHSTKEHKTSVIYNNDYRFTLDVMEAQPILSAYLDIPDVVLQGEIRKLDLMLKNIGNTAMKNVYLVHQYPGMLSSGNNISKCKGLFDFPLIEDSTLTSAKENGESVMTKLDFLPLHFAVDGKENFLGAGNSVRVPIWFRGLDKIGVTDIKIMVYYENINKAAKKRPQYRILSLKKKVKILPSIIGSANWSSESSYNNIGNEMLILHLTNISRDGSGVLGKESNSVDDILISQVSLMSLSNSLKGLQSSNNKATLAKMESFSLGFQVSKVHFNGLNDDVKQVHISSIKCKNIQGFACDKSPYIDFTKSVFAFNDLKKPPSLNQDTLVIFWQDASSTLQGQVLIPVTDLNRHKSSEDQTDDGKDDSLVFGLQAHCQIHVDVMKRMKHDFSKKRCCFIPCKLRIENLQEKPVTLWVRLDDRFDQHDCKIVGCSQGRFEIASKEELCLSFNAAVSSKGLYQCKNLQIQVLEHENYVSFDKIKFVPIEICFVVE